MYEVLHTLKTIRKSNLGEIEVSYGYTVDEQGNCTENILFKGNKKDCPKELLDKEIVWARWMFKYMSIVLQED